MRCGAEKGQKAWTERDPADAVRLVLAARHHDPAACSRRAGALAHLPPSAGARYNASVSTRTIWILRATLDGLSYVLLIGATTPLGTEHPSWFLVGGGVKLFLSSLVQQAGNALDPNPPEAAKGTAAGR